MKASGEEKANMKATIKHKLFSDYDKVRQHTQASQRYLVNLIKGDKY